MGTQAYLFGSGPSLDLVEWDAVGHPRYVINHAAFVVPEITACVTVDYHMLRYLEKKNYQGKVLTMKSRHSFNLNLHYLDGIIPIWATHYSSVAAVAYLQSLGMQILGYGFDSMFGVNGYSVTAKTKCPDYANLKKPIEHKAICRVLENFEGIEWRMP